MDESLSTRARARDLPGSAQRRNNPTIRLWLSLTDTVVIVTGGSTGSGRELVACSSPGGATPSSWCTWTISAGAEAAVDEIVGTNGTAIAVRADITDELDVERLFSETIAAFGGVDVIVHADPAGHPGGQPAGGESTPTWRRHCPCRYVRCRAPFPEQQAEGARHHDRRAHSHSRTGVVRGLS